ncbi:origin recognition complex subunit 6 [Pygocentrus nattereri]|uniref:Origin recognition complex subunit 6 n=1 Tax=Pygocentrus nattereri TaxID=42514 RepID=A0A3B4DZU8_PYGNA|nr:origin recognition complex subunit 6 [Pygocentrus nattereri]
MDRELFGRLASKMGLTSVKVLSQAEEYLRLSQLRCTGLGGATASSRAVICLELAATSLKLPLDKDFAVKLSGLNKKVYQSSLKSVECMLGLQSSVGLRELAVQYGCMDAVKVASQILERYEASLPAAHQQNLDLSKPLFTTAALFAACKCMKIRADKKLASSSGAKKGVFDRLCSQLQKFGQEICSESSSLKGSIKTAPKRQKTLTEMLQEEEDDDGLPTSPKQQREQQRRPREDEEDDAEEDVKQNYEEWKRKILENALGAKAADP